ncbi:uncharacterized protein BDW43DRAFT_45485 [Aspergillus alliaceus]|uniref:uncharacterized protein n=1 Tax=Petromyces alliaceus TaxID=209559 RepID=UPI0012A6FD02|nr:uncharacterized protein BDW43DRAFT_45485 [Aspergillus alliaceus]KAB8234883.1 hypothetical protein BDW43DRAFT_45485 [Aspergillus alliaceus]
MLCQLHDFCFAVSFSYIIFSPFLNIFLYTFIYLPSIYGGAKETPPRCPKP